MQRLRLNILFRCFWVVLACHILNLSIDTPDTNSNYVPEDLTFNDLESITELVLEKCLGMKNALVEYDEHDEPNGNSLDNKINFSYNTASIPSLNLTFFPISLVFPISVTPLYLPKYFTVFNPPPEV